MPNINSLLARSIMAYQKGLNSPVSLSDQFDQTLSQETIDTFVSSSLPTGDQAVYKTIMHLIGVAANLRKQTLLIESRQILEQAKAHFSKNTSSDLLQLLGTACIAQAESELCFQLQDYQAATE